MDSMDNTACSDYLNSGWTFLELRSNWDDTAALGNGSQIPFASNKDFLQSVPIGNELSPNSSTDGVLIADSTWYSPQELNYTTDRISNDPLIQVEDFSMVPEVEANAVSHNIPVLMTDVPIHHEQLSCLNGTQYAELFSSNQHDNIEKDTSLPPNNENASNNLEEEVHDSQTEPQMKCSEVSSVSSRDQESQTESRFFVKQTRESKLFVCHLCHTAYSRKSTLRDHYAVHSGIKEHVCKVCKKAFALKRYMQSHMLCHSTEPISECDKCKKTFRTIATMKRHQKYHCPAQQYTCDYCNEIFFYKSNLKKHMLRHTKRSTFACTICNKIFSSVISLQKHTMSHTLSEFSMKAAN